MRLILRFLIPLAATVILLFILFSRFDFDLVFDTIRSSNKTLLFLAVLLLFLIHFLFVWRWQMLLSGCGCYISYRYLLGAYFANLPIAKAMPFYSGEFGRLYFLKEKATPATVSKTVLLEIILDIFIISAMSLFGSIIIGNLITLVISVLAVLVLTACLLILGLYKPKHGIVTRLFNFINAPKLFMNSYSVLTKPILLSFFITLVMLLSFKVLFLSLGTNVSFLAILTIQPIVVLISVLPITLYGLGARESAMVFLYSGLVRQSVSLSAGLLYSFFILFVWPIISLPITYSVFRRLKLGKNRSS